MDSKSALNQALEDLRRDGPALNDALCLGADLDAWIHVIQARLLSRFSADFPMIATVCGGGSSGKSTLFNALVGEKLSPTGGFAGINRRALMSCHQDLMSAVFFQGFFDLFGAGPEPLRDAAQLETPGNPLYAFSSKAPDGWVILDAPDFDTGARGEYANREAARRVMEVSDILIYIFTNANYNNRDNTDFIASILTEVGNRKCFLVYRTGSSMPASDALDHAMTVARNIYGDMAGQCVLGIYRTDEDNAVAEGLRPMTLRPVREHDPDFDAALRGLDRNRLRLELASSMLRDVLRQAGEISEQGKISLNHLDLYMNSLLMVQERCVRDALRHFPMDQIFKRFVRLWQETEPAHIRAMRKTGNVVEWPFKAMVSGFRRIFGSRSADRPDAAPDFMQNLEDELIAAANRLYQWTVGFEIVVSGPDRDAALNALVNQIQAMPASGGEGVFKAEAARRDGVSSIAVDAHPALFSEQEQIRRRGFQSALSAIVAEKQRIAAISDRIDHELLEMAHSFRSKMSYGARVRQTFSALLNVLPATAAVTYVLSTGDPVGAAGIKVKLAGLFGLQDLYALIAIPATSGLKQADVRQLEEILGPVARSWLSSKLQVVHDLFEQQITGPVLSAVRRTLETAGTRIHDMDRRIEQCRGMLEHD